VVGVLLDGATIERGPIVISDNTIGGAADAAINLQGTQLLSVATWTAGSFTIRGNSIAAPTGRGIFAAATRHGLGEPVNCSCSRSKDSRR